jgi:hypothetical protein
LTCWQGGALELVGFRHCRLGDGAAQAVAELIKSSKTIVDAWFQHVSTCTLFNVSNEALSPLFLCPRIDRTYTDLNLYSLYIHEWPTYFCKLAEKPEGNASAFVKPKRQLWPGNEIVFDSTVQVCNVYTYDVHVAKGSAKLPEFSACCASY